jgi:TRAP-type C4-dicarboxylate transport system permease small subunit
MTIIEASLARLTRLSFALASIALAAILVAYVIEVIARYGFGRPTLWSVDLVSYALCATIFLAMPEITRTSGHVAITSMIEKLSGRNQTRLARLIALIGALLCGLVAYIAVLSAFSQAQSGIETVAAFAIPKWWLTGLVAYGFALSALAFALLTWRATRAGVEM